MKIRIPALLLFLLLGNYLHAQTLIAHYMFNGNSAADSSGNNLNGTIHGAVTDAAGVSGTPHTALKFDGSTGYVEVPASPMFNLNNWTIMAVVKLDGFYTGSCQDNRIVDHAAVDDNSSDMMAIGIGDNQYDGDCNVHTPGKETYHGLATRPSGGPQSTTHYIHTGQWYCFASSFSNDTMKNYVDGILEEAYYWPNNYSFTSNAPLFIAKHIDPPFPYYFNGTIDNVMVWNGALSQDQIHQHCSDSNNDTTIAIITSIKTSVTVGPNPAIDKIQVNVPEDWKSYSIDVYSLQGTKVASYQITGAAPAINVADFIPGIYTIRIYNGSEVSLKKFIKQ